MSNFRIFALALTVVGSLALKPDVRSQQQSAIHISKQLHWHWWIFADSLSASPNAADSHSWELKGRLSQPLILTVANTISLTLPLRFLGSPSVICLVAVKI